MGSIAARKAFRVLKNVSTVLAIELLTAAQGVEFLKPLMCGKGTTIVMKKIREVVPSIENDVVMHEAIERISKIVNDGTLLHAVERKVPLK